MKLIDISVPIDPNLPTYPGNTPFTLEPVKRLANGDSANVSTLHISAHAGTHVDAPWHSLEGGDRIERLSLDMLCGRVRVVEVHTR
jgi:arylformamidase